MLENMNSGGMGVAIIGFKSSSRMLSRRVGMLGGLLGVALFKEGVFCRRLPARSKVLPPL